MTSIKAALFLVILLLSYPSMGQYSFYAIKKSDIRMSNESFRRYAKPQIRSIINEYFHVLKKVSPESAPIISLRRNLRQLYLESAELTKECDPRDTTPKENCVTQINDFSRKLKLYESELYSQIEDFKILPKRINDSLIYKNLMDELVLSNSKVNSHFDEFKMLRATDFQRYSSSPSQIEGLLYNSLELLDLKINILIPFKYRVEFDNVWSAYIKVLEQRVLTPSDKEYLLAHLERLNIDWNSFHKNMTKGNYDIPLPKVKVTNIMHNRWNSILKLILRR
ncbi:hypothetical protein [Halobacteriovorax marinus]|nr:hypothetical protein [Halobacteriovorax marinus]